MLMFCHRNCWRRRAQLKDRPKRHVLILRPTAVIPVSVHLSGPHRPGPGILKTTGIGGALSVAAGHAAGRASPCRSSTVGATERRRAGAALDLPT